jgi:hypothetical protein
VSVPAETRPGSLNIETQPAGAAVFVENTRRGITPLTITNLPPGSHLLTLEAGGHQKWTQSVTLQPGEKLNLVVALTRQQPMPAAAPPMATPAAPPDTAVIGSKGPPGVTLFPLLINGQVARDSGTLVQLLQETVAEDDRFELVFSFYKKPAQTRGAVRVLPESMASDAFAKRAWRRSAGGHGFEPEAEVIRQAAEQLQTDAVVLCAVDADVFNDRGLLRTAVTHVLKLDIYLVDVLGGKNHHVTGRNVGHLLSDSQARVRVKSLMREVADAYWKDSRQVKR